MNVHPMTRLLHERPSKGFILACEQHEHTPTPAHAYVLATLPTYGRAHAAVLIRYTNALRHAGLWLGGINDSFLDVGCQAVEGLLNIDVPFCGYLHEWNAKLIGQLLTSFRRYGSLLFPVTLVPNQDLIHAFRSMLLDVRKPSPDVYRPISAALDKNPRARASLLNDRSSVTS